MKSFAALFVGLLAALVIVATAGGALLASQEGLPTGPIYLSGLLLLPVLAGLSLFAFAVVRFMGEDESH